MTRWRRLWLAGLILVVTGAVAAAALAKPIQEIDAAVTPAKGGTKKKPKNVRARIVLTVRTDTAGEAEPTTTKAEVLLPSEFILGGAAFASCKKSILDDQNDATKCPSKSKVGTGSAVFKTAFGSQPVKVTMYNGPKGKSLLMHLAGTSPTPIDQALEGKLSKAGEAGFGMKLVTNIPEELQQAALTNLVLNIKGTFLPKRKKGATRAPPPIPYIGLGPCIDKELSFKVVSTYKGLAEPGVGEDKVDCT